MNDPRRHGVRNAVLRVGFSLTLIGALLAGMFASQRGLGYDAPVKSPD